MFRAIRHLSPAIGVQFYRPTVHEFNVLVNIRSLSTRDDNAGGTAEAGASQKLKSTPDKAADGDPKSSECPAEAVLKKSPLAILERTTKNAG